MKKANRFLLALGLLIICIHFVSSLVCSQESQPLSSKLLTMKKAQIQLEEKQVDFERALKLKEIGLISEEDFLQKRSAYLQAQVDFQQAIINFVGSDVRISVASAVKFQDSGGKKFVRVSLRYYSRELKELSKFKINVEDLFPLDFLNEIQDIHVSLRSEGKIVSYPYEQTIVSIRSEEEKQVTFQLLKDIEDLDVNVFYSGKNETTSVYLQKGVSANIVTMNSAQFSLEADLESQAIYDLSLEKFSGEINVFKLEVVNLPRQITYEFIDPKTQARLSQIKFTEGITSMKLSLRLYLPRNADEQVVIDKPIVFYVLSLDNEQSKKLQNILIEKPKFTQKEIDSLKAGNVRLELIPRGVGRIEVQAVNLYHEIKVGEDVKMEMRVMNSGTRELDNIRVFADLPLNWRVEVSPDLIKSLEQNKEEIVNIRFIPPVDVSVGDYEPKIKTECIADNKRVESDDKIVRIHISSKTNILWILGLIFLLISLFVGIIIFAIKLTRR